ncbi:hypothetical protein E3E22_00185 [Thermococcus sp. MV5]|uniref:hypothetical protein n=1 Tax=Thermococcus sp. MV5 TaxID=1638272 RepID=UPI0014396AFD|nr:hypothetical protein [Thermococcus sp. MV5]NJE25071.1 hypothetical protein [Thermococcus sp. MV5]
MKALVQDEQSGICIVLIAHKKSEVWHYVEMELLRRYIMELIGGYGFSEEEYGVAIPAEEYILICIDNVGNYVFWKG